MSENTKIEQVVYDLLSLYPFFGNVLQKCSVRMEKNPLVPTAGVRPTQGRFEMIINPDFFNTLEHPQKLGLFIHEIGHIIFNHFARGQGLKSHKANLAADAAINCLIQEPLHPSKGLITPKMLNEMFNLNLVDNENFEYYYEAIKDKSLTEEFKKNYQLRGGPGTPDPNQGGGPGEPQEQDPQYGKPLDNHDIWQDTDMTEEEIKDLAEKVLIEAARETEREWGSRSVPAQVRSVVEKLKKRYNISWQRQLQGIMGNAMATSVRHTRQTPNRRLGHVLQGSKTETIPNTIIAFDESGSIGDAERNLLAGEIEGLLELNDEGVECIAFDTVVAKNKVRLSSIKNLPKRQLQGGTDFDPVIKYANENKAELLVVLTDGCAAEPKIKARMPVVWLIIGGQDNPTLKGKRLLVDMKKLKDPKQGAA